MKVRLFLKRQLTERLPGLLGRLQQFWAVVVNLFQVFKPCRFSVLMTLAGFAFLVLAPQGQDTLRVLAEELARGGEAGRPLVFAVAALAWASLSWYCARVMLYFQFPGTAPDAPLPPGTKRSAEDERRQARLRRLRVALPRWLGTACLAILALAHAVAGYSYPASDQSGTRQALYALAAGYAVLGALFHAFVVKRRDLTNAVYRKLAASAFVQRSALAGAVGALKVEPAQEQRYGVYDTLALLPGVVRAMLFLPVALALGLFLFILFKPVATGQALGAAPLLLIAAASWIPFGSSLVYFGERYRVPVITLALVGAVLFSLWNDNHAVRLTAAAPASPAPPDHMARFKTWLEAEDKIAPGKKHPLVLVAAEGGGIRAAYWTASVLGAIEEKHPGFGRHVFALSGVSGGSLGAAVYAALLAERPQDGALACRDPADGRRKPISLQHCAQAVLAHDFLGPVAGAMLYTDLAQRFLPYPFERLDRGRVLEQAWEAAWRETVGDDRFAEDYRTLWRDPDARVPSLVLNSTWVEAGKRVLVSDLRIGKDAFSDAVDLRGLLPPDKSLRLSSAAHASARFTYVSPAGTVKTPDNKDWGHLVDGGYFENSGAASAYDLLAALWRDTDEATWERIVPVVIVISNDPKAPHTDGDPLADPPKARSFLNEALSPLVALLNTRDARGTHARAVLRHTAEQFGGRYFRFALCDGGKPLPLGWQLSRLAREAMEEQLKKPCRDGEDGELNNPERLDALDGLLREHGV